jgi:hypothetical protein
VEVRTVHGSQVQPNARLQRVESGTVPCVHVEALTAGTCSFSTASHTASGNWLESPDGEYALVGQAVTLDGKPGGEWIVAARVGEDARTDCVEPTGMDVAGRVAEGTILSETCVVEEALAPWNAMSAYGYFPLLNYADGEVCSNNDPKLDPHPDGAEVVRSYARPGSAVDNAFCYTGYGAAMNDLNGQERDASGFYLVGEQYCHTIVAEGLEIPAAKRGCTKSKPVPGIATDTCPIVWRPVNPNVQIAN